jgi:hypothetical protein
MTASSRIEVNQQNKKGETALFIASYNGFSDLVTRLLALPRVNVNLQNNTGQTPLMAATDCRSERTVKLLLLANADVNIRDNSGKTAEDIARSKGFNGIISLLEMKKLKTRFRNTRGLENVFSSVNREGNGVAEPSHNLLRKLNAGPRSLIGKYLSGVNGIIPTQIDTLVARAIAAGAPAPGAAAAADAAADAAAGGAGAAAGAGQGGGRRRHAHRRSKRILIKRQRKTRRRRAV